MMVRGVKYLIFCGPVDLVFVYWLIYSARNEGFLNKININITRENGIGGQKKIN